MQCSQFLTGLMVFFLMSTSLAVHAQAACPPGTIPYGTGQGQNMCGPDDSQQQQPASPRTPPQIWVDHYGAMVSDNSLGKLGVAIDKQSEAEAWQSAEENCRAKGGLNCIRLVSYLNQCVAMVSGEKSYSFALGATPSDATRKANEKCSASTTNCHVYYSACSLPIRIQ